MAPRVDALHDVREGDFVDIVLVWSGRNPEESKPLCNKLVIWSNLVHIGFRSEADSVCPEIIGGPSLCLFSLVLVRRLWYIREGVSGDLLVLHNPPSYDFSKGDSGR